MGTKTHYLCTHFPSVVNFELLRWRWDDALSVTASRTPWPQLALDGHISTEVLQLLLPALAEKKKFYLVNRKNST